MAKRILEGWEVGMQKILLTTLLHNKVGISLKEAKNTTDRVLDNERMEFGIASPELAEELFQKLKNIGVKVRLEH